MRVVVGVAVLVGVVVLVGVLVGVGVGVTGHKGSVSGSQQLGSPGSQLQPGSSGAH